ncbi:MAG: diguanylate cyclase [Bacillati bacterium ANGP1]|uniref:Diguanylate cyclase n=1 Tax=Candidatus Segetimicrobium genomatis TaxID=2569760 RepID=A0A537IFX9_9BACT|nr:MAG: diguanylate cyclase [Terrabacteria group bacterium ANGP1]
MADTAGEQAGAGLQIVAGLLALGMVAGLAARLIPAIIAVPALAGAALLLAARGIMRSRAAAASATEAHSIRKAFAASGTLLRTLDETRVLRAAAETGARLSAHAGGSLVYLIEDGGRPALKSTWGLDGPMQEQAELPPLGADVAKAASTRKTVTISLHGAGGPYRAACMLPLQGKSALVGVLVLLSQKTPSAFWPEIPMLEYFAAQTALAIDNARLYGQVQDMFISSITALAAAVDAKDAYTHGHSEDIAELATMIARELQLSLQEIEKVRLAGLLHDLGKIGVPDAILRKPGKLDPAERAVMMTHVTLGASILDKPGPLRDLVAIVRHHHEHFDGHGYPGGLRGSEIPIGSAILAVADAFDAMTSHRAYHTARPVAAALEELQHHAGTQFHPQVVDALARIVARERETGSNWIRALETRIISPPTIPASGDQPPATSGDAALVWQLSQQLRDADDLPQLLTSLAATTAKLLPCARCAVLLLDERGATLSVEAATPEGPAPGTVFPRSRSPLWQAVEQRAAQRTGEHSEVYVPLLSGGQAVGVLQAGEVDRDAERLLAVIAETAAPVVQAALLRDRAERSAAADELTGLLNRRALVAHLHQEVARHKRYGTRFALVLADIIGLAPFNAQHGYDAGDDLVRRTAELLAANIRQVDFPARLQGGTLALFMPELDRREAERAVRRLQAMVNEREVTILGRFMRAQPLRWAIAGCPQDGTDADVLLAVAERRLRAEPEPSPH